MASADEDRGDVLERPAGDRRLVVVVIVVLGAAALVLAGLLTGGGVPEVPFQYDGF